MFEHVKLNALKTFLELDLSHKYKRIVYITDEEKIYFKTQVQRGFYLKKKKRKRKKKSSTKVKQRKMVLK